MGLVLDHLNAPPPIKLVALVLADHADADGICWPSYRRIAERSCLAERTVRRYVHELIDLGVIVKLRTGTVVKKPGGGTIRLSNAYMINADAIAANPSLLSTTPCAQVASQGHLEVALYGQDRWSPTATKPSLEPSDTTVSNDDSVDNPLAGHIEHLAEKWRVS